MQADAPLDGDKADLECLVRRELISRHHALCLENLLMDL